MTERPPTPIEKERATYRFAAWLYPRALAVVIAIAFVSLWSQIIPLSGEHGLAPASDLMTVLDERLVPFAHHPTLARFGASDGALEAFCAIGLFASLLVFVGIVPRIALIVVWALYLSLVNAGFPFTAFQWDILLLETAFASLPFVDNPRIDRPATTGVEPPSVARWVLWLLLFRLMFRSGLVKLTSGDPTWADLTALTLHYETQPIPTVFGWYAHQLPAWLHRASCAVMFAIELGVPFLLFVPFRWARRTVAAAVTILMLLIGITGNYGFFNFLTVTLCITLVDDAAWRRILPQRFVRWLDRPPPEQRPVGLSWPAALRKIWELRRRAIRYLAIGDAVVLIAAATLGLTAGIVEAETDPISLTRPFHLMNDYGLFAVMTTSRPEIELEGSDDGEHWQPYVFRYKAGPVDRAPPWVQPHMPRLDWQMWFAALGRPEGNRWLLVLMQRLLDNDPGALSLLARNPFPRAPPRYVRARLYDYRFTDWDEHARTGAWWRREDRGLYTGAFTR